MTDNSKNRSHDDEVDTLGSIMYLTAEMTPLNGIVYAEYIDG